MFFRWVPQVVDLSAPQDVGPGYERPFPTPQRFLTFTRPGGRGLTP
jgi:hypothetical protein